MSRSISSNLRTHLSGETTTIASLWKITRTDATVFGFTNHDEDIVVSGITYTAATGYTASASRSNLGLSVDNVDIAGVLDSSAITAADIRAGKWDHATVELSLVNWKDTSMGVLIVAKGILGEIHTGRNSFNTEMRGLAQYLAQTIGRLYMTTCDADLGDARCTIALGPFTVAGSVTSVTSRRIFFDSARAEANDYFTYGQITFTSGNNNGLSNEVKAFVQAGGEIDLHLPMPYDVQVGDAYSMIAGCDKTFATCVAKFANGINFQGFPHIPGVDRMLSGGRN